MLFYCVVVVVWCRDTYYAVLLSCSLVLPIIIFYCRVVLPIIIFHCRVVVVSCHVVLPIMLFYCCVANCIIIDDPPTRMTTILNCVYLDMRDLGGRGARKRLRCAGSNISKPNVRFLCKEARWKANSKCYLNMGQTHIWPNLRGACSA
jgi:hypothetical protein